MSEWNIAAMSKDEQEKTAVDLMAASVAYKERMNMPVVPEIIAREQPEHLREYFMERVTHFRLISQGLPKANDPHYIEIAVSNKKE
jgi:DNA polymerase-3 subunit theta